MLKISEVLANPSGTDKNAEYVVIRNTEAAPITVSGYSIKTAGGKAIKVTGVVPAGGELKVMTGSVALKNTGDTLSLVGPAGQVVDSFTYTTAADGQALQPAAFLTPELKSQLFDEIATTSPSQISEGNLGGQATPATSTLLLGIACAVILAGLSVYVLKQVRYDEIIRNPFAKQKDSSSQ